jgi:hypothetical protein
LKELIFPLSVIRNLCLRKLAQEMTQNFSAFSAIQDEVQFDVGHFPPKRSQKLPPRLAMRRVAIDYYSVHVENNGTQL